MRHAIIVASSLMLSGCTAELMGPDDPSIEQIGGWEDVSDRGAGAGFEPGAQRGQATEGSQRNADAPRNTEEDATSSARGSNTAPSNPRAASAGEPGAPREDVGATDANTTPGTSRDESPSSAEADRASEAPQGPDDTGASEPDAARRGANADDAEGTLDPPADSEGADDDSEAGGNANADAPSDEGGDADDGSDLWDWGDDVPPCEGCDPANFEGLYDVALVFQRESTGISVCETEFVVEISAEGILAFEVSCTSSTGLDFTFELDLFVSFDYELAAPLSAALPGTIRLTLPTGDVIESTFVENEGYPFQGFINLYDDPFSFYFGPFIRWEPVIETPSGPIGYLLFISTPPASG